MDAVQGLYDVYQRHAGQFEFYLPQLASVLANNASITESQALEVFLLDKSERCVAFQLPWQVAQCCRCGCGFQEKNTLREQSFVAGLLCCLAYQYVSSLSLFAFYCSRRSLHFAHRLYWFLNSYLPGLPSVSPAAAAVLSPVSKVAVPLAHAVTAQGKHAALSLWKQIQLQAPPTHKIAHTSPASRGESSQCLPEVLHHIEVYAIISVIVFNLNCG